MASNSNVQEHSARTLDANESGIIIIRANEENNKRDREEVPLSPSVPVPQLTSSIFINPLLQKRAKLDNKVKEESPSTWSLPSNGTTDEKQNIHQATASSANEELWTSFQKEVRKQNFGEVNLELEQRLYEALQEQIKEQLRGEIIARITDGMKARLKVTAEKAVRKELERRYMFAEAYRLRTQWDEKMSSQTRMVVRIGRDGEQETIDEYFCDPSHRKAAVEIIRRCDPENELIKACYAQKPQEELELNTPLLAPSSQSRKLLAVIVQLAEISSMTYEDAVNTMQEIELENRQEIFRCIACHPYYIKAEKKQKHLVRWNLVQFMHRHFTSQISNLTGTSIPDGIRELVSLQLGSDHVFLTKDDLKLALPSTLAKKNRALWEEITKPQTNKIKLRITKNKKFIKEEIED